MAQSGTKIRKISIFVLPLAKVVMIAVSLLVGDLMGVYGSDGGEGMAYNYLLLVQPLPALLSCSTSNSFVQLNKVKNNKDDMP